MKIQYASDLHLEFQENKGFLKSNPLVPAGDVLLLAGDIVPFVVMDKHEDFFSYLSDKFTTTYWVPGNHEYYFDEITERDGTLNEKIRNNLFLVNNTSVVHDNVKIIFSTLWSEISVLNQWIIQQRISDFQVINYKGKKLSIEKFNELHFESLKFLKSEIDISFPGKTIIVTHHVPVLLNYPKQYKNDVLNEAFAVDLSEMIAHNKIDYWIFGHHHVNVADFTVGRTKMATNQLGYVRYEENRNFASDKIIDI